MNSENNSGALTQPVNITSLSETVMNTQWNREHRSKHIELLYVLNGSLKVFMPDKCHSANKGDLIIIHDCLHRDVFSENSPPEVFYIYFKWAAVKTFLKVANGLLFDQLPPDVVFEAKRLLRMIRNDSGTGELDLNIENVRLQLLLMQIYRARLALTAQSFNNRDDLRRKHLEIIKHAKLFIEEKYMEMISLEDIAGELNISSFFLSRIFSKENDITLSEYLSTVRLNEALKLLKQKKFSLSEIAGKTGFSCAGYFSKTFKKHFGCSPSKYQH